MEIVYMKALTAVFGICIGLLVFSAIFYLFQPAKYDAINIVEAIISFIKALGYGVLAWFIWYYTQTKEPIDVLTYFTFMLACFEATHNLIVSLIMPVCSFISLSVRPIGSNRR